MEQPFKGFGHACEQVQSVDDPADAVAMLLEKNIAPNLPDVARAPSSAFRQGHLYCEEVDLVLADYKALLSALYSRYRLRPAGGGLRLKVQYCKPSMLACGRHR
jgi:hypothetical protein